MKSHQTKQIIVRTFLVTLFAITLLQTTAQRSGLYIGTLTSPDFASYRGGIPATTAALRKVVVTDIPLNKDLDPTIKKEKPVTMDLKKETPGKSFPAPVVTISNTTYDLPGNTATWQLTSLQAGFKFMFTSTVRGNANNPAGLVELYKLEKNSSVRSFCIPSSSCASLNIPIQIMLDGQPVTPNINNSAGAGAGAAVGKSPVYFVVIPSGYLQAGEYAFIDKSSLASDGTSIQCFSFTVK